MISKGNQRSGGQQLATHLLNAFDNERVEVADVRGTIAQDLHGAMAEWFAASKATRCEKYIYSLSINPDPGQRELTREEYLEYIARIERKLGLAEQARAVVFHVKHGREHCHVAWSRIDTERCRAVQISYDRQQLRLLARDFARDHGLELPDGLKRDRGAERFKDKFARVSLAEQQQQERTGETKKDRQLAITAAWRETNDAQSFIAALEKRGYWIARGERRACIVVDRYGEIHNLVRQIEGIKTKDLKERVDIDALPTVEQAREKSGHARDRVALPQPTPGQRQEELALKHQLRRRVLEKKRGALEQQHQMERDALTEAHLAEATGIASQRLAKQPRGVLAFITRITGIQSLMGRLQRREDAAREAEHALQHEALARRHERETKEFMRHERALARVEKRELRSLKTMIRREQLRTLAPARERTVEPEPQKTPSGLADMLRRRAEQRRRDKERDKDPGRER